MRLRISIRRVRLSVSPSVHPVFWMTKIDDFDERICSNDKIINATISDEVVASYGPPRSLFLLNPLSTPCLFKPPLGPSTAGWRTASHTLCRLASENGTSSMALKENCEKRLLPGWKRTLLHTVSNRFFRRRLLRHAEFMKRWSHSTAKNVWLVIPLFVCDGIRNSAQTIIQPPVVSASSSLSLSSLCRSNLKMG